LVGGKTMAMPSPAAGGPDTNAQTEVFAEVSPFSNRASDIVPIQSGFRR
jgi:hypothetical protein